MAKVAVILSGCGYLDGAEIRESVISLLALDREGAEVTIFAPDIPQKDVVNHLSGEPMNESRNVLLEAARIARGQISDLSDAKADDFDALIIPGGFGVAKNLSNLAEKGGDATILPEFKRLISAFIEQKKPIGAICISPAVLVAAIKDDLKIKVTIGSDADGLIASMGSENENCKAEESCYDEENNIASCPAYMLDAPIGKIADGIEKLVKQVVHKATEGKKAA